MSYQVLARKWRPKTFETLIGQDNTVQALTNALDHDRLHHAYLFTGTRGVGKTTLARILAKSLNCEKGISSKPCNACSACKDVDIGRFVDLIEVDAASNTKVDEMRGLLDNAQYTPSSGRFKIYIIDEVHMLSNSAFNAMLKTLEEPPGHIKFILATTDPKKVPVTVLSRCLQFNLKQMTIDSINKHLEFILHTEKIEFDTKALSLIAKSARGSMRDALSILDQAIAYAGGKITAKKILAMLGTIDNVFLINILNALASKDGEQLVALTHEMDQKNIAFDVALEDLAKLIYEVSTYQIIPNSFKGNENETTLKQLAHLFSAETLQLFYQISINGRKELYLAPDHHTGFSMTTLRMLAFFPSMKINNKKNIQIETKADNIPPKIENNLTTNTSLPKQVNNNIFDGDWHKLVDQLKLGITKSLAQECELIEFKEFVFYLSLDEKKKHLAQQVYIKKLEETLINYFNKKIKINISIGAVMSTPAIVKKNEKATLLKTTESAMMQDNFVKELINEFGAEVIPTSIEPIKKDK